MEEKSVFLNDYAKVLCDGASHLNKIAFEADVYTIPFAFLHLLL